MYYVAMHISYYRLSINKWMSKEEAVQGIGSYGYDTEI